MSEGRKVGNHWCLTIYPLDLNITICLSRTHMKISIIKLRNIYNCKWVSKGTLSISGQTEYSYLYPLESRQNENHSHRKLTKLFTWITALSNSVKLWAMLCRATQDRGVTLESSDKMWSLGEGNSKSLQYSCLENPVNSMKRQKDRTLKGELPGR